MTYPLLTPALYEDFVVPVGETVSVSAPVSVAVYNGRPGAGVLVAVLSQDTGELLLTGVKNVAFRRTA